MSPSIRLPTPCGGCDAKLSGGRGAAAAVAIFKDGEAKVTYAGVGNIAGVVASADRSKGMVSHNGILGARLLRTQQFEYEFPQTAGNGHAFGRHVGAVVICATIPGLFVRHAAVIAAVLYRDHARARDDVTVIVLDGRA